MWITFMALFLVLLVSAGVAQAQESAGYNLSVNSVTGGNYGGGTLSSASYHLTMSSGNLIHVSTSSPGFELCSGFICQSNHGFFQTRLPSLQKSPE